ncbi:putative transporter [Aspergillus steynii IBT 23096]|uniref:Putative transporter n=1 Tax=Aspergillus steynii IBT 23096 TaxID=1392250 RepID=A0A2I2G3B5_9EURO|nr:putative transporter [Aspergillus steynii IBT 23096]PLB47369.1 putative transporter [Aspergillus steynii IBT 23096]
MSMSVLLRPLRRRSRQAWNGIVRTVRDYAAGIDPRDDYEPIVGSLPDEETERRAHGVAEIEALATVWSTRTLHTGYALVFLIFFVNSFQQETTGSLSPYAFSAFTDHSLISTTNVLTSIVGGVARLPIAMMIDIWGRPEGFGITVVLCTIGLMLMAVCRNIETYVAAQIIYWLGYNGMDYVLHVFLSDTTDLVNRAFVYGVAGTPYIVTTFLGPAAAQQFYTQGALWWGFGVFAIVTPIVTAPLLALLCSARRKARTAGLIHREESGRTWMQSVQHYFTQFDTIGLVLITAAFVLILLPLTLASSQDSMWSSSLADRWKSPDVIAMLFLGCACVVGFVYWERFGATVCFVPFSRLKDRTLLGACILSATMFASFYSWDLYLSSYLQVVFNTSIRDTGYIYNIYTIGTCLWSVPLGLFIRRVGRLKWIALAAMPLTFLGTGLMLHFRSPDSRVSSVIMCEVFKAISGGTLVICQQMAAMATGGHETIAVSFALVGLFSKIGSGVGSAISGAIWTSTVPRYLRDALPADKKHKAAELYGSIATVLAYPIGTPERDATIYAYGVAQKRMLIAGISILPVAVFAILMWEDIRLKKTRQVRGNVF